MTYVKNTFMVGVPHMGSLRVETAKWLIMLGMANPDSVSVVFRSQQPVDLNRNSMIHNFLKSTKEWLLFIDSDMKPMKNLISMATHGKKIISGLTTVMQKDVPYPLIMRKAKDKETVCYSIVTVKDLDSAVDGVIKVDGVGTGCLLIHREVFEKIEPPWFKFEMDKNGEALLSEDYYFSEKATANGFDMFVDCNQQVGHLKTVNLHAMNKVLACVVANPPKKFDLIKGDKK